MQAKPVWIDNKEREMNIHAVFRATVETGKTAELHIAGTAFYRVFVNDTFLGAGPARTAEDYVREDVLTLPGGKNEIVIEAVGYYCRSLSTVFQPSYIMVEVQCDGAVIATAEKDFEGFLPKCKVQEVERYSVQRHFTEIWDYRNCKSITDECHKAEISLVDVAPTVIDRHVPYPLYKDLSLQTSQVSGTFEFDETLPYKVRRYSWKQDPLPAHWGFFDWDKIPHTYIWIQRQKQTITQRDAKLPLVLSKGEYAVFDFGKIEAGFIKLAMDSLSESDVVIAFNEFYLGEHFEVPQSMNVHNVIEFFMAEGDRREEQSFEPYTFRFVMVAVKEGQIRLNSVGAKTYMFDISSVKELESDDAVLNAIYRAGVRTFAHNAVDLYTDCPSRERAGWLCDSYFTGKTEFALTGKTLVEDAYLENYRLFNNKGYIIKGALPECYPADCAGQLGDGQFIPQWTMWYILEAEEYINKRGHKEMAEDFRASIYGLLEFYRRYENADGLLENLPSWNFVEWSIANQWTKDVNYPTQFLYAQVLESIYKIYGDEECLKRSEEVRKEAVKQSFNGRYFLDHAIRDENGKLIRQEEHSSEACQYYAILFGGVDIHSETYKELKNLVLNVFSPNRNGAMPEIFEVNMFIGAYLRLETLSKMKEYKLLLDNIKGFFGTMEEYTGTLWEYRQFNGSYDHGFASYALVVMEEALKNVSPLS